MMITVCVCVCVCVGVFTHVYIAYKPTYISQSHIILLLYYPIGVAFRVYTKFSDINNTRAS